MMNEDFLSKLDPKTRKRFISATEAQVEKQLTPSVGMDRSLGGGFGYGRQVLFWGNKSAGKSSFWLEVIGMAQKNGKSCAWFDVENSFEPDWATKLGVNNDELLINRSKGVDEVTADSCDLMKQGIDILVIDSISAIAPLAFFEKTGELSAVSDSKQIGAQARDLTVATNMWNTVNKNTLLVLISQQRNQFGSQHVSFIPTGGKAIMFNSSQVIRLTASEAKDEQIKGQVQHGDYIYTEPIGRTVNWEVQFNKIGPSKGTGEYNFFYQGESLGIDTVGEVFDLGVAAGLIERSGAWFTLEPGMDKIQGKDKCVLFLKDNTEFLESLRVSLLG